MQETTMLGRYAGAFYPQHCCPGCHCLLLSSKSLCIASSRVKNKKQNALPYDASRYRLEFRVWKEVTEHSLSLGVIAFRDDACSKKTI
eukprot:2048635-Rhodomonas_salina.3